MTVASLKVQRIASVAPRARRGLLIALALDGCVGLGEASPLPGRSRETLEDVVRALDGFHERMPFDVEAPLDAIEETLPPSLRFGLETAAVGLARAIGGVRVLDTPLESQVLGDDLERLDAVLHALELGARSFKLKIRSRDDLWRVSALRAAAPTARIRVDANRSFARSDEVPWELLAALGVEWIEEPCPGSVELRNVPLPIALDESIEDDLERSLEAVRDGRIAAVILKPTLLGARETARIAAFARQNGSRAVISHAFESEIGRSSAERLARELSPSECHGLSRWRGIVSFRAEGASAHDPSFPTWVWGDDAAAPVV